MNEVLEKYKDILINLNGRNRALVTKKLLQKRTFDIHNITIIDPNTSDKVKEYIVSNKESKLNLLPDYTSFYNEIRREIREKYQR